MIRPPPRSTLFPYTPLSVSAKHGPPPGKCKPNRIDLDFSIARGGWARPLPLPVRAILKSKSIRSEEHTSELQSLAYLVCRLLLEKKQKNVAFYMRNHQNYQL